MHIFTSCSNNTLFFIYCQFYFEIFINLFIKNY
nr:MAG TPA: hypothetical protein [Caudoviricetes sp.]